MRKQQIIAQMLRTFLEAQETLNGPERLRGDGNSVALMPDTWTYEYRELDRCLKKLRDERPTQYWHLAERYIRPARKRIPVVLDDRGEPKLPSHTELDSIQPFVKGKYTSVIVREWPKQVRMEKARRGLDFLADNFQGEPFVPSSLRMKLAA